MTVHENIVNTAPLQALSDAIAAAVDHMDMLGLAPWDIRAIGILHETAASNTHHSIQDKQHRQDRNRLNRQAINRGEIEG